jgi:hypothetical protein
MSEEKLCDVCQKLLSGDRNRNVRLDHDETHHVDAESFRKALQLPCYLCCFIWAKPSQATISDVDVPDGTKYNLGGFANESSIIHLQLQIHSEGAYPLRLQRWERTSNYGLPMLLSPDGLLTVSRLMETVYCSRHRQPRTHLDFSTLGAWAIRTCLYVTHTSLLPRDLISACRIVRTPSYATKMMKCIR